MLWMILPPPVSLVFAGISGFCGSEPFAVMIAVLACRGFSPAAGRASAEHECAGDSQASCCGCDSRDSQCSSCAEMWRCTTNHRGTALITETLRRGSTPGKSLRANRYIVETNRHDPCVPRNNLAPIVDGTGICCTQGGGTRTRSSGYIRVPSKRGSTRGIRPFCSGSDLRRRLCFLYHLGQSARRMAAGASPRRCRGSGAISTPWV